MSGRARLLAAIDELRAAAAEYDLGRDTGAVSPVVPIVDLLSREIAANVGQAAGGDVVYRLAARVHGVSPLVPVQHGAAVHEFGVRAVDQLDAVLEALSGRGVTHAWKSVFAAIDAFIRHQAESAYRRAATDVHLGVIRIDDDA